MPFVRVSWFQGRGQDMKAEIAQEITQSIAKHAGMPAESIYVVFEDVAPGNWAVGGELFPKNAAIKQT